MSVVAEVAPDRFTTEPIRAWKRAHLVADLEAGAIRFGGVGIRASRYDVDAEAVCYAHTPKPGYRVNLRPKVVRIRGGIADIEFLEQLQPHTPIPDPGCTCGFYAAAERDQLFSLTGAGVADLEVELSGTVDVFERGYRASHQRVVGVHIDRRCILCRASWATHVSTWRGVSPTEYVMAPFCDACALGAGSAVPSWVFAPRGLLALGLELGTLVEWGEERPLPDPDASVGAALTSFMAFTVKTVTKAFDEMAKAMSQLGAIVESVASEVGRETCRRTTSALERSQARAETRCRARLNLLAGERRRREPWPLSPSWWLRRSGLRHCGYIDRPPDHP